MLKGIPSVLSPDLFKTLMEMGHGDEIVLADGNFPAFAYPSRIVRCDGQGISKLLDAILQFMHLDSYVENPTAFMAVLADDHYIPEIWREYRAIGAKHEHGGLREKMLQKPEFYERAAKSYAVVVTSEQALYANLILKKGVVIV